MACAWLSYFNDGCEGNCSLFSCPFPPDMIHIYIYVELNCQVFCFKQHVLHMFTLCQYTLWTKLFNIYIYIYLYIHMMCVYIYIHIPRHGSRISLPLPLVVCSHQRRPLMWWTTRISSTPSTGARQHSPCWKDQRWPTACVFFDFWVAKKMVFFGVFVFFDFRFFQTWTYCGWKKSCTSS